MSRRIVFYVSGHGFGHASRTGQVIQALKDRAPDTEILVRSSAPEWFLREQAGDAFRYEFFEADTGVLQADSLTILYRETLEAARGFLSEMPQKIAGEKEFLLKIGAAAVFGDIPPLAFGAAHAAGLPSLGMTNFSWDWIYQPYTERFAGFEGLIEDIRAEYRKTGLLLRLPFSGGLDAFPRQEEIPLVARPSRLSRARARRALGLDEKKPVALLSFGGFSLSGEYYRRMGEDREIAWTASERVGAQAPGIRNFSRRELAERGLAYPDLVRAAEVVVTKPGYGILSECIANRTRMLYTERGDFREYPVLVAGAERTIPCRFISGDVLRGDALSREVRLLLEQPAKFAEVPLDGAAVAARRVLDLL